MHTYPIRSDEIYHYGIKRRSGRYPWGSGNDPYQSSGKSKRNRKIKSLAVKFAKGVGTGVAISASIYATTAANMAIKSAIMSGLGSVGLGFIATESAANFLTEAVFNATMNTTTGTIVSAAKERIVNMAEVGKEYIESLDIDIKMPLIKVSI